MNLLKKIALLAQKGGAGKTTLAIHLAVVATSAGFKTAIIDIDPQRSAVTWASLRVDTNIPVAGVLSMDIFEALDLAEQEGYDLIFIDTPPHTIPIVTKIAEAVDYIIIPCQPSLLDIDATSSTAKIVNAIGKKYVGVISRAPSKGFEVEECKNALINMNIPVCPILIRDRVAYRRALIYGKAVTEFEKKGKAAQEINELWLFLKREMKI